MKPRAHQGATLEEGSEAKALEEHSEAKHATSRPMHRSIVAGDQGPGEPE